jgi:hypothetical protein
MRHFQDANITYIVYLDGRRVEEMRVKRKEMRVFNSSCVLKGG